MKLTTAPGLAIFDLDYTLTQRGTWGRFVWSCVKFKPYVWLPLLIGSGWTQLRYLSGAVPRVAVKMAMMRWAMRGTSKDEIVDKGREFAEKIAAKGLRPGALDAINFHKQKGDALIIISAAVDVIAKPLGGHLGIEYVLSTEMAFDDCNIVQSNFKTLNCYGAEKVNRYKMLLIDSPELQAYQKNITFYSDSFSDIEMFNVADVCFAIHPDKKLSQYAKENKWPIVKW